MSRWFPLAPADPSFVRTAPQRYRFDELYAAPVEEVWASMISDESLAAWSPLVSSLQWDAAARTGIGARRELALLRGAVRVREEFTRWDAPADGQAGFSFQATGITAPGYARFAEDYALEADGDGTRYRWTVAMEPASWAKVPARLLSPVNRLAFGRMARDGKRYFARNP